MTELSPLLRAAFGPQLAPELRQLCQQRPQLLTQLAMYSARHFHAVVAWLLLAPRPTEDAMAIADLIAATAPRRLLQQALPEHTPELWSAFKALPASALSADTYNRLDAVARGPAATLLATAESLSPSSIGFYESLAERLPAEPLLADIVGALEQRPGMVDAAYSALTVLRAYKVLGPEADAAAALRSARNREALGRFVMRRIAKVEVPVPMPPNDSLLRPITSVAALRATGRRLNNCLTSPYSYPAELILQHKWFYEWTGGTPGAVSLDILGPGLACISEIAGAGNADLSRSVQGEIHIELGRAGIRLLPFGFSSLLHRFHNEESFDDFEVLCAEEGIDDDLAEAA